MGALLEDNVQKNKSKNKNSEVTISTNAYINLWFPFLWIKAALLIWYTPKKSVYNLIPTSSVKDFQTPSNGCGSQDVAE